MAAVLEAIAFDEMAPSVEVQRPGELMRTVYSGLMGPLLASARSYRAHRLRSGSGVVSVRVGRRQVWPTAAEALAAAWGDMRAASGDVYRAYLAAVSALSPDGEFPIGLGLDPDRFGAIIWAALNGHPEDPDPEIVTASSRLRDDHGWLNAFSRINARDVSVALTYALTADLDRIEAELGLELAADETAGPPGPFAALLALADTLSLSGNDARIVRALCDGNGRVPLADLATLCGWSAPFDGAWNSACYRLKGKLRKHGWTVSRHDNDAVAKAIEAGAEK